MIQRFLLLPAEVASQEINVHLNEGWRVVPGTVQLATIEGLEEWKPAGPNALRDVNGRTVEGWVAVTLQKG